MTNLAEWAERQFREVEQNGAHAVAIKLLTAHDNEVWETWLPPWPAPAAWAETAETYLRSLENEWPSRAVSVVFVALSASGETLAKLPRKVTGKNKASGSGPWNSEQAAFAMMMDNMALSLEKFQKLVNTQLDQARRTLESDANTMFQQTEYIKLLRQNAAMREGEEPQPDALTKLVSEHSGDLMGILKMFAESSIKKAANKTNGAITVPGMTTKE